MLTVCGTLLLLFSVPVSGAYAWSVVGGSFFILSFVSLFGLGGFGWWCVSFPFSFDMMSSCLVSLSLWLAVLMIMANWAVFGSNNSPMYFLYVVVFLIVSLVISFSVSNFFSFYIFFEFSLVPTFFLILGWGYQPERVGASMYMVLYTVGASLPLLGCMLFCYSAQGHLTFFLPFLFFTGGVWSKVLLFLFVLAFLVKIPVFFVHLWLPKAHVEAPVAGSMILAGVLLKLGGYGLVRIVWKLSSLVSGSAVLYLSVVLWGGVVTGLICLRQVDLKGLIAYSSVGHMGFFVGGVFSNNVWGWQGGLVMLLGHGLCSSAMFALANVSYESVGSRSMILIKGFVSVFPFLTLLWFLVSSSNMAAPPSLNLVSEIMLFVSVLGKGWIWSLPVGFLSFLGGAYSLYLYTSTQHGSPGAYCGYLPVKVRSFYMVVCHWLPLNLLFLSSGFVFDWVF